MNSKRRQPTKVSRPRLPWVIAGGGICLALLLIVLIIGLSRPDGSLKSTSPLPTVSPSESVGDNSSHHRNKEAGLVQAPVDASKQSEEEESPFSPGSVPPLPAPPPLDEATHQKIVAGMDARMREETKRLYGDLFKQLHLSSDLQEKVIDIELQPLKQLEQRTFEAAQSGKIVEPPSQQAMQEQKSLQDQQLRSALGDAGFAAFSQYRATTPDRMIISDMNQQGANLSEGQSAQLLQILTSARQQVMYQANTASNLNSMPPDQVATIIQQQEDLLEQTLRDRTQNLITPAQQAALQEVLSQRRISARSH
jgi:hypothetical protein